MSSPLGFLAGTSLLDSGFLDSFQQDSISTDEGTVSLYRSPELVAIQRHAGPDGYRPPHRIRHEAHFRALDQLGVGRVFSLQSAGSLREEIPPGSFLLPDDFIQLGGVITAYDDERGHVMAKFSDELRKAVSESMESFDGSFHRSGTYVQTPGPRFETPAEAKLYADHGDCVGMTAASELIVATQFGMEYTTLCSIDNYVNGIAGTAVTIDSFQEAVKEHETEVRKVTLSVLDNLNAIPDPNETD